MGAIHDNIKFHSNRNDQTQNSKPVLQEKKMNQENCQPNPTSLSSNNKNEIFATVKFDFSPKKVSLNKIHLILIFF